MKRKRTRWKKTTKTENVHDENTTENVYEEENEETKRNQTKEKTDTKKENGRPTSLQATTNLETDDVGIIRDYFLQDAEPSCVPLKGFRRTLDEVVGVGPESCEKECVLYLRLN